LRRARGGRAARALAAMAIEDASIPVAGVALRELTRRALEDDAARALATKTIAAALGRTDKGPLVDVALESIEIRAARALPVIAPRDFIAPLVLLANDAGAPARLSEAAAAMLRRLEARAHPT